MTDKNNSCTENYTVCGKTFPVVGRVKVVDSNKNVVDSVPILDIPQLSDYQWQANCLQDRIEHPEKYEKDEDVQAEILKLRKWLSEHTDDSIKMCG